MENRIMRRNVSSYSTFTHPGSISREYCLVKHKYGKYDKSGLSLWNFLPLDRERPNMLN